MEWAITATFYAALHYLEAYLATQGIHSQTHVERDQRVNSLPELRPLYGSYRRLKNQSLEARYGTRQFPRSDVTATAGWLDQIKSHISNLV